MRILTILTGLLGCSKAPKPAQQQQAARAQQPAPAAPAQDGRKCSCGATAAGKFCPECGDPFDDGDII